MDTNAASPVCSTETGWWLVAHLTTLSGEQQVPLRRRDRYHPAIHCLCTVQTNLQLCYVYDKMFFLSVASCRSKVCPKRAGSTAKLFVDVLTSCNSFIAR